MCDTISSAKISTQCSMLTWTPPQSDGNAISAWCLTWARIPFLSKTQKITPGKVLSLLKALAQLNHRANHKRRHPLTHTSNKFRPRRNKTAPQNLKILNVNTQSISDKKARFQNLVDSTDPDIVVMTETWLKPDRADGEIGEPGRFANEYNIHRRDRPGAKPGGGVLIAVKKQLTCIRQVDLEPDTDTENAEIIWIKIPAERSKTLYIGGFYRPKADDRESTKHLKTSLERLRNTRSHVWIAGDMNFPYINWENHTLKPNHKYANLHNSFMDMLDEHHMCQTIKEPTRGENTLDLFLTNNESLVNNCQVTPGISDHSAVLVESRVRINMGKQRPRQIPMWNKMKPEDSEAFRKYMKEGWESISDETKQGSADTLWKWLTSRLEEGIKNMYLTELLAKKTGTPGFPENWNKC